MVVKSNGKSGEGDDAVDPVVGSVRVVDAAVTLADHHAEGLHIFIRYVAFALDIELVVEGEETTVKDVGLPFCRICDCRIDGGWIPDPHHADEDMVVSS